MLNNRLISKPRLASLMLLTIVFGVLAIILPVYAAAPPGPSIKLGDPTCPTASGSFFSGVWYVYYDATQEQCVSVSGLIGGFSQTTSTPNYAASGSIAGLNPIYIPTFLSLDKIQSFSIFSYISIAVTLVFILLIIYWVVLILRAALGVMHGAGDPAQLTKAQKHLGSVFAGAVFLIGFFLLLNIVASFLGIGNFTEWPKVFSQCKDGSYYLTKELQNKDATDPSCVDSECFSGGAGCR